jgi:hypothetical protein
LEKINETLAEEKAQQQAASNPTKLFRNYFIDTFPLREPAASERLEPLTF